MIFYVVMLLLAMIVPSIVIIFSVRTMTGQAGLIFRNASPLVFKKLPPEIDQFIVSQELSQTDVLRYAQIPFAVYRFTRDVCHERYFVVMAARGAFVCDICTDFSDKYSLTTTRSANGFVHPRAQGSFIQGFTKIGLAELWNNHLTEELFLLQSGLVNTGPLEPDIALRIEQGLRRQGEAIKGTSLYWLKAPYWFYIKRHRMVNKTVTQQLVRRG